MNRYFLLFVFILIVSYSNAQTNDLGTLAGQKGIWILFPGKIPKDFNYMLERKSDQEPWAPLAEITFPKSKEDLKARLLLTERISGLDIESLSNDYLSKAWQRLLGSELLYSPVEIKRNLPMRQAIGTAYYDAYARPGINYQYRLNNEGLAKDNQQVRSQVVSFPGQKFSSILKPLSAKPKLDGVTCRFEIVKQGKMYKCRLFRSYYLRSGFEEIKASSIIYKLKNQQIIQFTDLSASKKVPYTYMLLPQDEAGNPGDFSPEIQVFDVAEKSIIPSVRNFRTESLTGQKAIKLSWTLPLKKDVVSVDIYKSASYSGVYHKIASVPFKDSVFLDHYVKPIETYFYSIVLNGIYENSTNSPRISGILKASNLNFFPPQGLNAIKKGNSVLLQWKKTEKDTRAYFVYRAKGLNGEFRQISKALISESSNIRFIDSLPSSHNTTYYKYALSDENTSYALGPLSRPVIVIAEATKEQIIPYGLEVKRLTQNAAMLIWPDFSNSKSMAGFIVSRKVTSIASGKEIEPFKPLIKKFVDSKINHFIDSNLKSGFIYVYRLQSIASQTSELSSPSLEQGLTIPTIQPNCIANLKIFNEDRCAKLRWDNPIGENLKSIIIYRAVQGSPSEEIKRLPAGMEVFKDISVNSGRIYFYSMACETSDGRKSSISTPVGIHIL